MLNDGRGTPRPYAYQRDTFMIPFLRLACLISILTTALLIGGWSVGRAIAQPPPAAIADLDACELPCWRGMTPRDTPMYAIESILRVYGYAYDGRDENNRLVVYRAPSHCSVMVGNSRGAVGVISLTGCGGVQLGDVMTILGEPDGMVGWNTISFRGAHVYVTVAGDICRSRLTPYMNVLGIFIVSSDRSGRGLFVRQFAPETTTLQQWLGFATRARYYQAAPELQVCR
jgi:hypothetical protein